MSEATDVIFTAGMARDFRARGRRFSPRTSQPGEEFALVAAARSLPPRRSLMVAQSRATARAFTTRRCAVCGAFLARGNTVGYCGTGCGAAFKAGRR